MVDQCQMQDITRGLAIANELCITVRLNLVKYCTNVQ